MYFIRNIETGKYMSAYETREGAEKSIAILDGKFEVIEDSSYN